MRRAGGALKPQLARAPNLGGTCNGSCPVHRRGDNPVGKQCIQVNRINIRRQIARLFAEVFQENGLCVITRWIGVVENRNEGHPTLAVYRFRACYNRSAKGNQRREKRKLKRYSHWDKNPLSSQTILRGSTRSLARQRPRPRELEAAGNTLYERSLSL